MAIARLAVVSLSLLAGMSSAAGALDLVELVDTGAATGALTAIDDTLFLVNAGPLAFARSRQTGALDTAFGGDGILGNEVGEHTFTAALHLTTDGSRLYISDDSANLVYVVDPGTGALDTSVGLDGILGNDTGGANPEPALTNPRDLAIIDGWLYIADLGIGIHRYRLDGSGGGATLLTAAVGPNYLAVGARGTVGPCNLATPFGGDRLLYVSDFNDDLRCVDAGGNVALLLHGLTAAMRDHAFALPVGTNCSSLTPFADGTILYTTEGNGGNEQRCTGADGSSFLTNDADAPGLHGVVVGSDGHLYLSASADADHRLFRSQELVSDEIFRDGFEAGDTGAWSGSVP